jgi:hypothetical protein
MKAESDENFSMRLSLGRGYLGAARRKGRQQTTQTYDHRATSRLYRKGEFAAIAKSTAKSGEARGLQGCAGKTGKE